MQQMVHEAPLGSVFFFDPAPSPDTVKMVTKKGGALAILNSQVTILVIQVMILGAIFKMHRIGGFNSEEAWTKHEVKNKHENF